MKKKIVLVLCLFILETIFFSACVKNEASNTAAQKTGHDEKQKNTTTQSEEINTVSKKHEALYDIAAETASYKDKLLEYNIEYPAISGIINNEIQEIINTVIIEKVDGFINEFEVFLDKERKQTLDGKYTVTYKSYDLLSIKFFLSSYLEGAAYPNNNVEAVTINLETGEVLELENLFKKEIDYKDMLNPILQKKVEKLDFELFEEYRGIEGIQDYYLTDSGIVIFYREGVYTPHAVGALELKIDYEEIKNTLNFSIK